MLQSTALVMTSNIIVAPFFVIVCAFSEYRNVVSHNALLVFKWLVLLKFYQRLAEYNEGDLPKYVFIDWNVEVWLSELDALGCDPASLNKLLHLNKLDPKTCQQHSSFVLYAYSRRLQPISIAG